MIDAMLIDAFRFVLELLMMTSRYITMQQKAMSKLLKASHNVVAEAFGLKRHELQGYFDESVYSHLGFTLFFDCPIPNGIPLGGNNVRSGWHAILVEHDQYLPNLRPPAVTVIVASIAMDSGFKHHRLGTTPMEHTHEEIARILWDDEMAADSRLPDYIDLEIMGMSSATQIVGRGPLPAVATSGLPVVLATNIHGEAPYFTASLESAIQAGNIAAAKLDPKVEQLPSGGDRWAPAWYGEDSRFGR